MRPTPKITDLDLELEEGIGRLREYRRRLSHGRLHLVLDVHQDETIAHELYADPLTTDDLARLMQERPGVKR
jgi:hypothetical protein